ncbi:MAG: coproporphyrinogen III oxidase [Dehalococcoidia bacterium]|nr:coproporphyrinogen III oxidase [Dehalococcoidia bacterium]
MGTEEFVENIKRKTIKELLDISGTGVLNKRNWPLQRGYAETSVIRGGAIEKAAILDMTLRVPVGADIKNILAMEKAAIVNMTLESVKSGTASGEIESRVFQIEIFPENPFCPMGHFNMEWMAGTQRQYSMNLDLFPSVRIEEDLIAVRTAIDAVAERMGKDKTKIRESLDTQYTMEHFTSPLASKSGCSLRRIQDQDLEFFLLVYETFHRSYLDILRKRKNTEYTREDNQLKLERNGRWLQYLLLKDRAVRMAQQLVPPQLIVEFGFPPSAVF